MSDTRPSTPPGGGEPDPSTLKTPKQKRPSVIPYRPTSRAVSPTTGRTTRSRAPSPTGSKRSTLSRRPSQIALSGPGVPGTQSSIESYPSQLWDRHQDPEDIDVPDAESESEPETAEDANTRREHVQTFLLKRIANTPDDETALTGTVGKYVEETATVLKDSAELAIDMKYGNAFKKHIRQVATGSHVTERFPGNTLLSNAESLYPQSLAKAPDTSRTPSQPLHRPHPPVPNTSTAEWMKQVTEAINTNSTVMEELQRLVIHVSSQTNILAAFDASVIHQVELRLRSIEEKLAATSRPLDPQTRPTGSDVLDTIARKVTAIEQTVKTTPKTGNPPGQASSSKTPAPPPQPLPKKDDRWWEKAIEEASMTELIFWAATVTLGKWGAPNGNAREAMSSSVNPKRDDVAKFLRHAAEYHFGKNGTNQFPCPDAAPVDIKATGWSKKFPWKIADITGKRTGQSGQRKIIYAPGTSAKTESKIVVGNTKTTNTPTAKVDKGKAKETAPEPPSSSLYYEDLNDDFQPAKSKRSYAKAAAASKGPITKPQNRYANVPVNRFMDPVSKAPPRGPRGLGKRWLVRFHKDDKPTTGTRLPIEAVADEVNRACKSFNVKVNTAEWTSAQNLVLFFTGDSIDTQIQRAGNTILGVLARGCPKTVFLKSVKWSRIVIRSFPTHKWVRAPTAMEVVDGSTPGEFVPIQRGELEAVVRASHPLLTDAIFTEDPDWTSKQVDYTRDSASVSFSLPDEDESLIKNLTRRPLFYFNRACHLTAWVEKIKLTQCPRCWRFGDVVHPNCPFRCQRCGGPHELKDHDVECKECIKSDINQEDRKAGKTICPHTPSCPACMKDHYAGSKECRMRDHAVCEARQRKKVGRGQAFISSYTRPKRQTHLDPQDGGAIDGYATVPHEEPSREQMQAEIDYANSHNPTTFPTIEQQQKMQEDGIPLAGPSHQLDFSS